ncbi:16271_t:CDS:2, partial [Rhizophagus irregularis]
EILPNEQPNDSNSFNSEEEIDINKSTMNKNYIMKIYLYTLHYSFHLNNRSKVSISKRVNVKRSKDRMNARSMRDELLKHVKAGELEEEDIPK